MILEFEDLVKKYNMNISGVIHIGAHYGEEVSNYVNLGIKDIVLFEPLEENFEILKNNVSELDANITGYCVALGNKNQDVNMFLSSNNLESSSVLKPKIHLDLHPNVVFYNDAMTLHHLIDDEASFDEKVGRLNWRPLSLN
jgi:FkbM family methyltransferase